MNRAWHCNVCDEDKTSMAGSPTSGLCADCRDEQMAPREWDGGDALPEGFEGF